MFVWRAWKNKIATKHGLMRESNIICGVPFIFLSEGLCDCHVDIVANSLFFSKFFIRDGNYVWSFWCYVLNDSKLRESLAELDFNIVFYFMVGLLI